MVPRGLNSTTLTVKAARPALEHLAPAQTVCNYVTLWFRNASSLLSEGDTNGTWQRFIVVAAPPGKNNEGGPSSAPANGPGANFLHSNPYPNTPGQGRPFECEAGAEVRISFEMVRGRAAWSFGGKPERAGEDRRLFRF